jgi:preprotein translocase subunit YajC
VTYTLNSSTSYYKGQATSTFAALSPGERVGVQVSTAGSTVASSVRILEPMLVGTVQSVSDTQIIVADQQGFWHTIDISSSTSYQKAGALISLSSIKVGDMVSASGTIASDHTSLNADSVTVMLPHLGGKVTAVSGDTITIARPDGSTGTITVNSATTYFSGSSSTSLAAVTVGSFVDAQGTATSTNALTAMTVHVMNGGPHGGPRQGPGGGFGGPGGGIQ